MERKYAWLFANFQKKRKKMDMFVFQLNEENGKKEYVFFFCQLKEENELKENIRDLFANFQKKKENLYVCFPI